MRLFFVLRLFPESYRFLGPYTEAQLCSEMKQGRISLSDLAYSPDDPGKWRRLLKFERLLECQPAVPENAELIKFEDEALERIEQAAPRKKKSVKEQGLLGITSKEKIWYLQSQGEEFGPFNFAELGKILDSGKLSGKNYVWKEGLANWIDAQSLEQILTDLPQAERSAAFVIERGSNKRIHVRSFFIATVSLSVGGIVHSGICLDISEGGLQVGKWDAKVVAEADYSLLITPLGLTGIAPFAAEAKVSWIDEKSERTGFRFKKFKRPEDQKLLIEYLTRSQYNSL
jgi:hypothetical protein